MQIFLTDTEVESIKKVLQMQTGRKNNTKFTTFLFVMIKDSREPKCHITQTWQRCTVT